MEKIKVNNQVVSMRKFVKQAKIHAINKCTKQIKFLENRKGNEEQMAKTKRKHQRLLEEVNILKKIKPDSVSKLALSKAKNWKAVLGKKNVPLEERCFALLVNHPPVQKAVEKFHCDNSELVAKIPELVKQWEVKKSRSSQIYKKKEKGNQNNANDSNTFPIGNTNNNSEAQIECQSTKSLESLPNSSHLKSVQEDITEQNLAIGEATKRQEAFDNLDPTSILSIPDKKKLVIDDERSDASDNSLSDSSDFSNDQNSQIKEKLSVADKTKSDQFYKNLKQSKACATKNQTNLAKKGTFKKDTVYIGDSNERKGKSSEEEHSEKSQDIIFRLLEISRSKTKVQNKPRNKTSTVYQQSNAETDSNNETSSDAVKKLKDSANVCGTKIRHSFSTKPEVKNKIKAVTMLDLNELQDVDEIPIEKSASDAEDETDEDSGKQTKDPFFLRDGEPISESDEDENAEKETARERDFPPFKTKPYGNFREHRDNSFQKGKFQKHSMNERNSNFRESNLMKKRKEFSFKDSKRKFKQTFDNNADYRQNKNFKFASKDKFNNRNGTNNFTKNPKKKPFSQNHNKDGKGNSYPSKPNLSNSSKKNTPDDKPLHPSWEAKRKLKEAANTKFQGKRMVFND